VINDRIEAVIEQLLTDDSFRGRFQQNRQDCIGALGLTPAESTELQALDIDQLLAAVRRKTPGPIRSYRGGSAV
jgi:hypothetical protein